MPHDVSRRAVLGALAVMPASAAAVPLLARAAALEVPGGSAAAGPRFRTLVVDASRVAALGNPTGAERLRVVLGREMRQVFADLVAPNAPGGAALVARISSLYLTSYAGSRDYGRRGAGSGSDSLDGVGVVTAGGRAVSETPILAVLDPEYSGAWYLPNIDDLRLQSISHQFAWWLRREMGV